jgi:hypothetical protein
MPAVLGHENGLALWLPVTGGGQMMSGLPVWEVTICAVET